MQPCPGNWVEIGRAVVYYARDDQAFSAGIKCRYCNKCLYESLREIQQVSQSTQKPPHSCFDGLKGAIYSLPYNYPHTIPLSRNSHLKHLSLILSR